MEVKKKRKKVILQIGMICAFIFSFIRYIPDAVYADTSSVDWSQYWYRSVSSLNANYIDGYKTTASGKHVTFYSPNCFYTCIISTTDLSSSGSYDEYKSVYGKDGPTFTESDNTTYHKGSFTYNGVKYFFIYSGTYGDTSSYRYVGHLGALYNCTDDYLGSASKPLISGAICDYIAGHLPYTCKLVCDGGEDGEVSTDVGSVNNPIEDTDIGCLVISKKKSSDLSGLGDNGNSDNKENLFRVRFGWKYKTNTGFSLQKNKYAQTFIQVRIQNRSVVYKNLSHTEIKRKLNSYGENAIIYSSLPVDHQPLVVTLTDTDFLKKYLPKYYAEINTPTNLTNALFLGNKYAFQFRVVCTDDLSVIPGNNTGAKWHCGRWTETSVDFDPVTPTDDEQKTGDIDDDGNFVQNEDDTTTKIDDASDKQYDSDDDASDDFNNSSKNNKDGFNWDSFKSLINQCKEVPGLIKSIFSFLPDWVLVFIAVGFGIWIFVLIKRAIV